MTAGRPGEREHLLLYEPRTEGHHLGWLRFITEDLLAAEFQLTLAVDFRAEAQSRIRDHLGDLLAEVTLTSAYNAAGRRHHDRRAGSVLFCLRQSGASNAFLCAFDEIASHCFRRAAFGLFPPAALRGRMGGIYHRPRFLEASRWSLNGVLKGLGYRRLLQQGWLRPLLLVDEYLARQEARRMPGGPVFFLPDPCPTGLEGAPGPAREQLGVPLDSHVFLFYGGGYRRKGLHVAVEAMLRLPQAIPAFLLCAGQQQPDARTAHGLGQLAREGRARAINRYVSTAEERLCFAACDGVLLPYLNHFGTSGVLSRAMAARKMVIVSEEQLLGRLTREHGLGLLFPSGDAIALRDCLAHAVSAPQVQRDAWRDAARCYARRYSRDAYRLALWKALGLPKQGSPSQPG